jgi:hypothetical protein
MPLWQFRREPDRGEARVVRGEVEEPDLVQILEILEIVGF